ncbi:hypothetical protein IX51_08725 [uncultured archaeon]|nr:hypothetical protein IX51_08725 [uncultured archaeon]HKJ96981.1 hypothetical protein [Thermoplasmataceae archaeon]
MVMVKRMAPTDGQIDIISTLAKESLAAKDHVSEYLLKTGKEEIEGLSMKEASQLIDELKRVSAKVLIDRYLTPKQLIFIDQLQDTPQRRDYTNYFLKVRDKRSINSLSSSEASELIAVLKSMRPPSEGEKLDAPMTIDQIEVLNELQNTEERRAVTDRFLNQTLSKDMKELTRQEADELIGLLE